MNPAIYRLSQTLVVAAILSGFLAICIPVQVKNVDSVKERKERIAQPPKDRSIEESVRIYIRKYSAIAIA